MHLHSESPLLLLLLQKSGYSNHRLDVWKPCFFNGMVPTYQPSPVGELSWVDPGFRVWQPEVVLVGPLTPAFWIPPSRWTWHTTASVPVAASCYQRFWGTKKFLQKMFGKAGIWNIPDRKKKHIPCLFEICPLQKTGNYFPPAPKIPPFWDAWCQSDYVASAKVSKDYSQLEGWRLEMAEMPADVRLEVDGSKVGISMGWNFHGLCPQYTNHVISRWNNPTHCQPLILTSNRTSQWVFFGVTTAVVTSEGVNGLYAAGTISHSLDFRKSAGGGGGGTME